MTFALVLYDCATDVATNGSIIEEAKLEFEVYVLQGPGDEVSTAMLRMYV